MLWETGRPAGTGSAGTADLPSTPGKGEARWQWVWRGKVAGNADRLEESTLLLTPPQGGGTWLQRGWQGVPLSLWEERSALKGG